MALKLFTASSFIYGLLVWFFISNNIHGEIVQFTSSIYGFCLGISLLPLMFKVLDKIFYNV